MSFFIVTVVSLVLMWVFLSMKRHMLAFLFCMLAMTSTFIGLFS